MIDRRDLLAGAAVAALAGCVTATARPATDSFVARSGAGFLRGGRPYRVVGANLWYAAWLGADAPYGNRARLGHKLINGIPFLGWS